MAISTIDWSDCPVVEVVPGKVSGAPLLRNTRPPASGPILKVLPDEDVP